VRRREAGFFRGSELPRLLLLAGLAIVGWGFFLTWKPPLDEPPPPSVRQLEPLPPPETSEAFEGIQDRNLMSARETEAYAQLLDRVRQTPFDQLDRASRRDVLYSQVLENPKRYRGLPIHVEGTALRVLVQYAEGSTLFPAGRYHEAYVITADSQNYPWILAFEDAPADLQVGDRLRQRVSFDGYFLKLLAYKGGNDKYFVAPLLVGRFPPVPVAGKPGVGPAVRPEQKPFPWTLAVLVAFTGYALLRLGMQAWRLLRPRERRVGFRGTTVTEHIEPAELDAWLASGAADEPAAGPPGAVGDHPTNGTPSGAG
jgi:hypothetical protein